MNSLPVVCSVLQSTLPLLQSCGTAAHLDKTSKTQTIEAFCGLVGSCCSVLEFILASDATDSLTKQAAFRLLELGHVFDETLSGIKLFQSYTPVADIESCVRRLQRMIGLNSPNTASPQHEEPLSKRQRLANDVRVLATHSWSASVVQVVYEKQLDNMKNCLHNLQQLASTKRMEVLEAIEAIEVVKDIQCKSV